MQEAIQLVPTMGAVYRQKQLTQMRTNKEEEEQRRNSLLKKHRWDKKTRDRTKELEEEKKRQRETQTRKHEQWTTTTWETGREVSSQSKESSRTNMRTRKQHTANNRRYNNYNACHQDTSSSSVITLKGRSIRIVLECWGWAPRGHVDMKVSTVPLGGYKHMHTCTRASWPGGERKEEWTMENLEDEHSDTCSSVTQKWL